MQTNQPMISSFFSFFFHFALLPQQPNIITSQIHATKKPENSHTIRSVNTFSIYDLERLPIFHMLRAFFRFR